MRTAVVLVSRDGWELTRNCLEDLSAQLADGTRFVVALADNGSGDGTPEKVRRLFPAVRVVELGENLGFGTANNRAIRALTDAGEEFDSVCLLNNDTRFAPDFLPALRGALVAAESLVGEGETPVVVPTVRNPDGTPQPAHFAGFGLDGIGAFRFLANALKREDRANATLRGTPSHTADPDLLETHWASAVCWIFPRRLHDALAAEGSFFDERIFMYCEDADLALRARDLGARFFVSSRAVLFHLGGGSARSRLDRALQHDRSMRYVLRKRFGLRGALLSAVYRALRSSSRALVLLPFAFREEPRRRLFVHLRLLLEILR